MNSKQVEILVKKGESSILEFKTSTSGLRPACETLCAFLNNKGGTVLIGINDKGKIIGQDVTDNTKREIAREIKKIEPTPNINIDYVKTTDGKHIIALRTIPGEHIPYTYDNRAFERNESQTDRMSRHRYNQLLASHGELNHSWDELIATNYDLKSLDHEEIYRTVNDGVMLNRLSPSAQKENIEKIMRQLDLFNGKKLKRAAVALFAKEIKSGYKQCWLKMARFKGTNNTGDFIDNKQVYCNLFQMLENADHFIRKHLPIASYFNSNQLKRTDKLALPMLAIREALVNAICHRNYMEPTGYISIAIFDDRIEIWNNGTLPDKLKLADLKHKHDSILRNKLIAEIFYKRGYIEGWGTGIAKMIDFCKQDKVPVPKFSERTDGFLVTFKFAEPIAKHKSLKEFVPSQRQRDILRLLEKSTYNSQQLAPKLKGSPAVRTVQADLLQLENEGFVKREGKARAMVWIIKK